MTPDAVDTLRMYTVYHNPRDYPDKWVVRGLTIGSGIMTPDETPLFVGNSLGAARHAILDVDPGLFLMPRQQGDEPQIIETWV